MSDDVANAEIERFCELSSKLSTVLVDLVSLSEPRLSGDSRKHLVAAVTVLSADYAEFARLCIQLEDDIIIADPGGAASVAEFELSNRTGDHHYVQKTAHEVASITLSNISAEFANVQEKGTNDDEIQGYADAIIRQKFDRNAILRLTSRMAREIALLGSKRGIQAGWRRPNGGGPRFKFGNGDGM